MPWVTFRWMTVEDIKAIYAYLQLIPAVANPVPDDIKGPFAAAPPVPMPAVYDEGDVARNLPPGVSAEPIVMGPGVKWGTLVVTAAPDAPIGEGEFEVVGTSLRGEEKLAPKDASGLQYREHTCQPSPPSQASKKLRAVCSIELFIGSLQQEDTTSEIVQDGGETSTCCQGRRVFGHIRRLRSTPRGALLHVMRIGAVSEQ
jgi:hypothetical protein